MPRFDPNESLGFHCNLTLKAFLGAWERELKGTGVSPAQIQALAHLIASGPLSQSELVDLLSITPASGVRLVDRMERDGLVIRRQDTADGRVKLVVPTKRAVDFWEEVSQTGFELLDQAYKGVSSEELDMVKSVLAHVRRNLGA